MLQIVFTLWSFFYLFVASDVYREVKMAFGEIEMAFGEIEMAFGEIKNGFER
ncbi:hypothetical protein [Methanosarcina sp. DH2]|uniref:hypothetical protein n=1 Tax=Methanosarcina sp. DH2 TaxID=2605639 RepID=UPI001E6411C0|nr:hypothetical protein [Methanosarcina sp. DH2]